MRIQNYVICFVTVAASLASATASASEFITIGPGFARDVSADGSVVITSEGRWTRQHGLVTLPEPEEVSYNGSVVVGNIGGTGGVGAGPAYRWTAETEIEMLDPPPDFPGLNTVALPFRAMGE